MITKIEKITGLSEEELITLLIKLLQLKGFSDVEQLDSFIVKGDQQNLLSKDHALFITFPFKLGGSVNQDISSIGENISEIQSKNAANSIFLFSKYTITKGFQNSLSHQLTHIRLNYIDRDGFISLVDEVFPEYWRHNDLNLIQYEKEFIDTIEKDSEWKKLSFPNEKYAKLLSIFIEPRLVRCYQDKKTNTPLTKGYSVAELIDFDGPVVIDGNAGSGKSTLLKRIGRLLVDQNATDPDKKNLPVYVTALDISNANYDVKFAIQSKLLGITEGSLAELKKEYDIQLLIDSIDEFDESQKRHIISDLDDLSKHAHIKYYIATRNADSLIPFSQCELNNFNIRRFNLEQIKLFLNAFFSGDESKASTLLDALRDNQMLERLPITPLTLSLISILFEETEFEIPATISDIYDNFNALIIGKAVVSSKIEFIDISFKERILSIYAFALLERPGHFPMTLEEFLNYFKDYFEGKSLPIKKGSLEDVLYYLIQNTGILYLKDGDKVQFSHDSYMEYYAALEIFKHKRAAEEKLVQNFFDPNWQNAAIFYAGKSKDMPEFLQKIKDHIAKGNDLNAFMSSIFGAGYLLQALYQTDNKLRRDVIIDILAISLKNLEAFKLLAANDMVLFKDYRLPILSLINFIYFYESFNSITLTEPLKMAFESKFDEFEKTKDVGIGYNLLELAFTLDSKRIRYQDPLEKVIYTSEIMRDPTLNILAAISVDVLGKERYKEYKDEIKRIHYSLTDVQKRLIEQPVAKLRFTALDTIRKQENVTLLVEGKTDAVILEHAYMVLTDGAFPYWRIEKAGHNNEEGSAAEVSKTLTQAYPLWKTRQESTIIGLYDHDNAGLGEFGRLNADFVETEKGIKKHKDGSIYAVCIPVPGELENYLRPDQMFNFFEIEHYFGHDYLRSKDMLKKTDIPGIYAIKDGPKVRFASEIKKEYDASIFKHFILLFKLIDKLTGTSVQYITD